MRKMIVPVEAKPPIITEGNENKNARLEPKVYYGGYTQFLYEKKE